MKDHTLFTIALAAVLLLASRPASCEEERGEEAPFSLGLQVQLYAEPDDPGAIYANALPLVFDFDLGRRLSARATSQVSLRAAEDGLGVDRLGAGAALLWRALGRTGDPFLSSLRIGPEAGFSLSPDGGAATLTASGECAWAFAVDAKGKWFLSFDFQLGCSWIGNPGSMTPGLHLGPTVQLLFRPSGLRRGR
jgi:hypothetical protein